MPKDTESGPPQALLPYLFHGLDLDWGRGEQATGECPFCGGEKLTIKVETGVGNCFSPSCPSHAEGGKKGGFNGTSFLRILWQESFSRTALGDYSKLAQERGYLGDEGLIAWGAARSVVTGEWMLPGFSPGGKLCTLYVRRRQKHSTKGSTWVLKSTSGVEAGLYGMQCWSDFKRTVYVTEGPWDGIALFELLSQVRQSGVDSLELTADPTQSLLGDGNVVSCPGAGTFKESWLPLLDDRDVVIMYDNDKPGYEGAKRLCRLVEGARRKPASVKLLWWGDDVLTSSLPDGWDIRDALSKGKV